MSMFITKTSNCAEPLEQKSGNLLLVYKSLKKIIQRSLTFIQNVVFTVTFVDIPLFPQGGDEGNRDKMHAVIKNKKKKKKKKKE